LGNGEKAADSAAGSFLGRKAMPEEFSFTHSSALSLQKVESAFSQKLLENPQFIWYLYPLSS